MSDMAHQTTQLLVYPPDNRTIGVLGTKTVHVVPVFCMRMVTFYGILLYGALAILERCNRPLRMLLWRGLDSVNAILDSVLS